MPLSDLEMNALEKISIAMDQIETARTDPNISIELDGAYSRLYDALDKTQTTLIQEHVEKYLKDLEEQSKGLKTIIAGIQADINKIKKLSDAIDQAAKAIGAVVDIAKAAIAAGIL